MSGARIALLLLALWAFCGAAAAQTIRFVPLEQLPEGTRLGVLLDDQDAIPDWLTPTADDRWEHQLVTDPRRWRTEPTFVLEVQPRDVGLLKTKQMRLQLPLSFKATETVDIEIPLVLFSGTGIRIRNDIDIMESFRRYEQILLAEGLTRHFLQQLHPQDSATRRMSRAWFDAMFRAIDREGKPLRMAPFVIDVPLGAFQGDQGGLAYIRSSADYIRSLFWRDAAEFEGLLEAGACDTARALLTYLEDQHRQFPEAAAMRSVDATATLAAYETNHAASCP